MENVHKLVFLNGLKAGIRNKQYLVQEQMNDLEWSRVIQIAAMHSLMPLLYQSLYTNPIPEGLKARWKKETMIQSVRQIQKEESFFEIYDGFLQLGVIGLVVKGVICRQLYPRPELRISADEDILIQKEDLGKVHEYLTNIGFIPDQEYSDEAEEIGYRNTQTGVYLEIHTVLFGRNTTYGFLNNEFINPWKDKKEYTLQGHTIYSFSDQDHLFYLFAHAYKHFIHGGFGLRQLCDILLYLETYQDSIDKKLLSNQLRKYHLDTLWNGLLAIGNEYLGFNNTIEGNIDTKELLEDLLQSGIYGKSSDERIHSANMTLSAVGNSTTSGSILSALFPTYKYMSNQFPLLKKYKLLLPYYYLVRIVNYKKKQKNASATIELGKQRIELLKKYKVIE